MAESGTASTPSEAPQKKRGGKRTARACDECRMRKSKCDGLCPCEACQITDRYCTYNLSAARSTGSGTRIRILEDRLRRARAYLAEAQKRTPSLAGVNFDALLGPVDDIAQPRAGGSTANEDNDQEKLDSMMDSYGQMTLNTNGSMHRDFYGAASGLAWIRKTGNYFNDSDEDASDVTDGSADNDSAATQLFDAPLPPKSALRTGAEGAHSLPPRETATYLLDVIFKQVYPMFHFLWEEDFHEYTDRLYEVEPCQYTESDQSFLPLFYMVMALGYLFSREQHDILGCRNSVAEAMRHFIPARAQLDIAHLRTIISLQTIVCLILFLISTARMASAHAFLGAACASAMRQGLHFRSTHEPELPDKERRTRRRVFWAVVNLDMYISGILGLPTFMDLSAVDPAIDTTIEAALQEVKTDTTLSPGDAMSMAASARHIELLRIVFRAQRALYPKPSDPPDSTRQNGAISVSVSRLQEFEDEFRNWAGSITDILTYPVESLETQSIKYEMHISYYFAQIVIYRAFMHYLAKQHEGEVVGQRQLNCARTCVQMANNVLEVSIEHQRRGLLCPASWSSVYTVFISTVCLIFAYATRTAGTDAPDEKINIENAIRLLACTACTTDTGSVRCLEILRRLLKRVSYAVEIDLDKLCSETQSCCTTNFDFNQETAPFNVEEIALAGPSGSESSFHSQGPPLLAGLDGQGWTLSPDVTMTRPSLTNVDYANQAQRGQQQQAYFQQQDEMMEVPYGGTFSWPQHDFHATAMRLGQSSGTNSPLTGQQQISSPSRLSADDIATYMHINPVDESFFRGRQNG